MRAYDSYYHANPKGTGSAVRMELHPARISPDGICTPGCIFMSCAMQKSMYGSLPSFDWDNKIVVKLDRSDLSQIIQVFRGMRESINDGKGLLHRYVNSTTIIRLSHHIEPVHGYLLNVIKKSTEGDSQNGFGIVFTPDEALTLMLSLEQAMMYVCFGMPYAGVTK